MDWNILVDPMKDFLTVIFEYLPRILGALVLLLLGWILAKVLRSATRGALRATRVDRIFGKGEDPGKQSPVAQAAGTLVFWLVWVFFLLAILQMLGLEGVAGSVVTLFERIFAAVPNILGAIAVLAIFYLTAGILARLVTRFLTSIQFDHVPVRMGLSTRVTEGRWSPSSIVGYVAALLIMLFALIMATDLLRFAVLTDLVSEFTQFVALAILAVVILAVGIFLVNVLANMLQASGLPQAVVTAVRVFLLVFVTAIALSTLGVGSELILLGFGLILGSIALASAIAFGLGGRDAARDLLARWSRSARSTKSDKPEE